MQAHVGCCGAAGLAAASEELPVVGDTKAQTDAQMLLDACQAAQLDAWVLPLALLQEDINCLAGGLSRSTLLLPDWCRWSECPQFISCA